MNGFPEYERCWNCGGMRVVGVALCKYCGVGAEASKQRDLHADLAEAVRLLREWQDDGCAENPHLDDIDDRRSLTRQTRRFLAKYPETP